MVITESEAKHLVALLNKSPGYPKTPWLREQLGDSIRRHCPTVEYAKRVIQHCLEYSEFCPKPVNIRDAAQIIPRSTKTAQQVAACERCSSAGWLPIAPYLITWERSAESARVRTTVEALTSEQEKNLRPKIGYNINEIGKGQIIVDAVERCDCTMGGA